MNSLKTLLKISFTAILAYLLQMAFPWWAIGIASFLISFILYTKGFRSFVSGFLGIALLWFILAAATDISTDSILSDRIAKIFSLPSNNLLILVTSLVGGLFGGATALFGSHLRRWIMPTE